MHDDTSHDTTITELRSELASLRAEVADMRRIHAELAQRAVSVARPDANSEVPEAPVSRRTALRAAGAIAAGALAGGVGVLATATPAAATTQSLAATPSDPGLEVISGPGDLGALMVFSTNATWSGAYVYSTSATAIGAQTDGSGMTAIFASATAAQGYGLRAQGKTYAAWFEGIGLNGIGARMEGSLAALWLASVNAPPQERVATYPAGCVDVDNNDDVWYCAVSGTPGTWRKLAGPTTAGAFHAIAPARVYDSRATTPAQGVIVNRGTRTVSVADKRNADGSVNTANIIPAGATAIAANVTVTGTTDTNNFCINPGGDTSHPASTINWFASGQTLANGVVLTLNSDREVTIVAGAQGGSAHVIIDVTGYWL